jgi:hypothetical protein
VAALASTRPEAEPLRLLPDWPSSTSFVLIFFGWIFSQRFFSRRIFERWTFQSFRGEWISWRTFSWRRLLALHRWCACASTSGLRICGVMKISFRRAHLICDCSFFHPSVPPLELSSRKKITSLRLSEHLELRPAWS